MANKGLTTQLLECQGPILEPGSRMGGAKVGERMFARLKKTVALFTLAMFTLITVLPPATFAETFSLQGGSVDVDVQDQVTNWNVSGNPIWNMPEFNVAQGSIYNIAGLSAGASLAVLVNGGKASNIFGTMNLSNLDFILQNIAGINIGASGMINLNQASLIAATLPLNLSATDFLKHDYRFDGKGGFLMNEGTILGSQADLVALVAQAIENRGVIDVPMGTVALAAGDTVTVGISPDGLVSIGVDAATANEFGIKSQIKNTGSITADGGTVNLTAKALDGLFDRAISIERNNKSVEAIRADNGTIVFESLDDIYNNAVVGAMNGKISVHSEKGSVTNAGTLDAEAGKISIEVLDDIVNEAIIKASNGEIFLDSGAGDITNAGTLEAEKGSIEIRAAGDVETMGNLEAEFLREHAAAFRIGGGYHVSQSWHDNLDDAITYASSTSLSGTINDVADIIINAGVTLTLTGATSFNADSDSSGSGAFLMNSTATIAGGGFNLTLKASQNSTVGILSNIGTLTLDRNGAYTPAFSSSTSVNDISVNTFKTLNGVSFSKTVGTGADAVNARLIYDVSQLQGMGNNLGYYYKLANDIDASETASWNSAAGFVPIGNNTTKFTGGFNGNSKTITGLTINRPAENFVGLFGAASGPAITGVGLLGGTVTGLDYVGGLVGLFTSDAEIMERSVSNSYSTGSVTGRNSVGGLVGELWEASSIDNSYATGSVSGSAYGNCVGGLVGNLGPQSSVNNSYATGRVSGSNQVGGLVGAGSTGIGFSPNITGSYATGNVSGDDYIGGLVGFFYLSSLANSYATGSVSGDDYIGGLLGFAHGSFLDNSYATGDVNGSRYVGGLMGWVGESCSISNAYATGRVNNGVAGGNVGGLIGETYTSTLTNNWWFSDQAAGIGNTTSANVTKAAALSDFYGTGSGTGGVVYTGASPWDFTEDAGHWNAFSNTYPRLDYEWSQSITTLLQLQNMSLNLGAHYTLANDIDASPTAYWNWDGTHYLGFDPVGDGSGGFPFPTPFTGSFDGDSHTVSGFTINRPSSGCVGLFTRLSGTISNIGFVDGSVTGADYVGGFVGTLSGGSITNSYFEGDVVGANTVGGFVGYQENGGSISTSYSSGTVSGGSYVGGLAGSIVRGSITNCYSTSSVLGTGNYIGGLAGHFTQGNISNSYSAGTVRGTGGAYSIGGLVGRLGSGSISNSFNTGVVSGEAPFVWAGAVLGAYQSGTLTNVWYAQHSAARDVGDGKSVSGISMQTGATLDQAKSAFYGSSHAVYTGASPWDFATVPVWDSFASALPLLHAESPTYTIAGLLSGLGAGISMALSLNGATAITTTTTDGGAFSFGSVTLNGGEYLLVYANDGSYKANLVGVVQSAGNISGLTMYDGRLAIGDADGVVGTSFTNSSLSSAYYSNANVYYSVTGGALTVTGIDLWVPTGVTFTPGGSVTVTGAGLNIEGTLNAALNAISSGGSWTNLISGSKVLNVGAVTLTGTGTVTETGNFEDLTVTGTYTQSGALTIDGIFDLNGGTFTSDHTLGFSAYDFRLTSGTFNRFTGNGSSETPYTIYDVYGLQAMSGFLSSKFKLNNNISASSTSTWNSGAGFDPVGTFAGWFNGNGKTITGLTINRPAEDYVGLFSSVASASATAYVYDVGLVAANITGGNYVGGIAGYIRSGTFIEGSYTAGSVSGTNYVGGLVGYNETSVVRWSYSTAAVSGAQEVGGLIGTNHNGGAIAGCYATGSVTGSGKVGGLVGRHYGDGRVVSFQQSFSTGVAVSTGDTAGGLIGFYDNVDVLNNNWWYNGTNSVGIGTGSSSSVTKAAALSDFYGTGSGTGGAVYAGSSPWNFATIWQSVANELPHLKWENYSPGAGYTIAGIISGLGAGISMALSLNGAAPVTTTTTDGGAFSFGSVTLSGSEYLLIYANDGSYKANLVGRVQSAGNISGLTMYDGRLAIGDAEGVVGTSFTNSSLSSAHYSNANVYYSVTGGALTVSGVDLWIPSAITYTPGGNVDLSGSLINSGTLNAPANIYVTGNWTNSGTFSAGTGTVTFDGTSAGKQITAGGSDDPFNNISFTGAGGQWTLQDAMNVSGKFKVTDGSFISGANTVTVEGANATYQNADVNAANTTWAGGTLNLQSDTNQTLPNDESYAALHLGRSAGTGTTVYTRGSNFTFGSLAIDSGDAKVLLNADATGTNKVYDGLSTATVSFSDDKLSGYGDIGYSYSAAFAAGKNVGTGKTVNVSGISLTGSDAVYYSLSSSTDTTTANITAKAVTLSGITAANKTYDATTAATVSTAGASFTGIIAGDALTVSSTGVFANKNVAAGKTVTLTNVLGGADLGNYTVTNQGTTTADITAFALTLNGVVAGNKVYDGTTAVTVSGTGSISGVFAGDTVSLVDSGMMAGSFANKNVGTGKAVIVTGFSLSGADASNYSVGSLGVTADITAKAVTLSGITAANKIYDGTTTAPVSTSGAAFTGMIAGDILTVSSTGTFANKNVGVGKTVSLTNVLGGADIGNYTVTEQGTATADITAKVVTLSGITAANKTYDATTAATVSTAGASFAGMIEGDALTVSSTGVFGDKNVATGKPVTLTNVLGGADLGNYTVTDQGTTMADITAKVLTITGITAGNKVYDATTTATVSGTASLVGVLGGDVVSVDDAGVTGSFLNKNVGSGKTVNVTGFSLAGADAANYSVGSLGVTADITAKAVTLSGITAINKVYDGATAATVSTAGADFDGMIAGDDLTVSSTGVFGDKNVGVGKTVTLTNVLGGTDLGNYTITQQGTTAADITAKVLSITGTTNNKIYDGTVASHLNTADSALSGVVSGDESVVTLNKTSASVGAFASKNVGTYTQAVNGFSIEGAGVGNYTLVQPTLIDATISPKVLTVTGATAANKAYNGSTAATLDTLLAALVGVLGGEEAVVSLNASSAVGAFASPNVGTWAVAVTGMILTGAGSGNYSLTQPTLSATITSATPPGSGTVDRTLDDIGKDPPGGGGTTIGGGSSDPGSVDIIDETGDGGVLGNNGQDNGGTGGGPGDPGLPGNDDGQITDGSKGGEVGLSGSGHYDLQDTTRILYALEDYFEAKKARSSQTNVRVLEGVVYVIDGENAMSLLEEGEAIRVSYKTPEMVAEEGDLEFAGQPSSVVQGKVVSPVLETQGIVPVESPEKTLERDWALAEALKQKESEAEKVSAPKVPLEKIASPIVPLASKKAQESVKTKPSEKTLPVEPKVVPTPEPSLTKVVSSGTLKNPGENVFVKGTDGKWQPAKDGMVILPGHEVKTATTSSVNVVLDEGKVGYVELKGGSLFRISKVETDSMSGDKTTLLDLAVGRALVHAAKLQGKSRFEVRTPTAISGVRGTVFEIVVNEKPLSGAI